MPPKRKNRRNTRANRFEVDNPPIEMTDTQPEQNRTINSETNATTNSENTDNLMVITNQKHSDLSNKTTDKNDSLECRALITVGSVNPKNYDGTGDVDEWIDHFTYISKCNNWDNTMQLRRLPIHLKETAELWFRNFSENNSDDSPDITAVFDGLRTAFRPMNFRSINQSALISRVQRLQEPVNSYHYDMLRLCRKINPNMSEEDKLTHVMRGLKSGLLEKVLVLEPKDCQDLLNKLRSIEEAEFLSNARPDYNLLLVNEKKQETDKKSDSKEEQPKADLPKDRVEKLCDLVEKLVINETESQYGQQRQWQGKTQFNPNSRAYQNRLTRTVDGRPICHYCKMPGHVQVTCWKRKRDLSITDAKRVSDDDGRDNRPNRGPNQGNR